MLGYIADKLSHIVLKVSTALDHFATFLIADEPLDVTSPNYAKWKYRIQHTVGKKSLPYTPYRAVYLLWTVRTIFWNTLYRKKGWAQNDQMNFWNTQNI